MTLLDLPAPSAIETLAYEPTVDAIMAAIEAAFEEIDVAYDVGMLETDPTKIQAEVSAYRDMALRARINDALRSNLVAFAVGSDLDHIAAHEDVTRIAGEKDTSLRERVILASRARSKAGTKERYEYLARSASADVRTAYCYRIPNSPEIKIAIVSYSNGGVPSPALLATVQAAVSSDTVRVLSDVVTVVAAASVSVPISANIWLLPDAAQSVFGGLEQKLRAAWSAQNIIGLDLMRSWIVSQLHAAGVAKVELIAPTTDIPAQDGQALALGAITLTLSGRIR